jgi:hypothetical protein
MASDREAALFAEIERRVIALRDERDAALAEVERVTALAKMQIDHESRLRRQAVEQAAAELAVRVAVLEAELRNIATADWRKWEAFEEKATAQDFVDWAQSRARHALTATQGGPDA